jgi:hypothetical protein
MRNFTGGICGYVCQDYLHSVKKSKWVPYTWLKSGKRFYES